MERYEMQAEILRNLDRLSDKRLRLLYKYLLALLK